MRKLTRCTADRAVAPPQGREVDNLDRLLGLLEQARAEQAARAAMLRAGADAPYRRLLTVLRQAS